MRSASSGLRHPASASCLGRHSRLAGRCPNNSSLFPPLAAVVVVATERIVLNFGFQESLRTFLKPIFTGGVGTNSLSQSLTALTAPSGREPLARPDALRFSLKLYRHAKGPISEGAVAVGDWGSSPTEKGCLPDGRQPFSEENKENTRPKGQSEYQNILSSL